MTPQQFVDNIVTGEKGVLDLWKLMNISNDRFIRTTDDYHVAAIQKIFRKMYENGDIYKGSYKGKYCTPCESFWTESQLKDGKCPDCGGDVVIRKSRYGKFYACTNFPKCKYTKAIRESIGVKCPKCGGEIVRGFGRHKSVFYNCENYPKCDFSVWDMPVAEKCPKCGGILLEKRGKKYLYCMDEKCGYKSEQK